MGRQFDTVVVYSIHREKLVGKHCLMESRKNGRISDELLELGVLFRLLRMTE